MINSCMNYNKHYAILIERAKTRVLEEYTEKHHIIPRCLGGTNKKTNLVKLTPEEHYVAHQLLVKMYPKEHKLVYAANMMTVASSTTTRNNKIYGWLKKKHSSICKQRLGSKNPSYGRKWYYDPVTGKNGKFDHNIPINWIAGRSARATVCRYCKTCNIYVDTVFAKAYRSVLCKEHRYLNNQNRTNRIWHTPAGSFSTPAEAAIKNNCTRKTIYNRTASKKFNDYFITA